MTSPTEYKYDVAFSFTAQQERIATQLYNLLKDRLNCFIYSEAQKDLAGKDGEKTFNEVFGENARIVVILYDGSWGNTKWTKIEETAIRNRGFEEGYDFVILVPLESDFHPPKWLPKNKLWVGFHRWGIDSAASVIEARAQEHGSIVKELSVADQVRIQEEQTQIRVRNQRKLFENGRELTLAELKNLTDNIIKIAEEVKNSIDGWQQKVLLNNYGGVNVMCQNHSLLTQIDEKYSESGSLTCVRITIHRGYYNENLIKTDWSYDYQQLKVFEKQLAITDIDEHVWVDLQKQNPISSDKLAELVAKTFYDTVNSARQRKYY
jgi:hypothetical protein